MVRELVHDPLVLGVRSRPAAPEDYMIAEDLIDTLRAHSDTCAGMAANMIGKAVRIIAFYDNAKLILMFNPEIVSRSTPFEAEESCLSLLGEPRKTTRYRAVKVRYQDSRFKQKSKTFVGFPAQIIQHEVDHCDGVLI